MTEYVDIVCSQCGRVVGKCNPPAPPVPVVCARCQEQPTPPPDRQLSLY